MYPERKKKTHMSIVENKYGNIECSCPWTQRHYVLQPVRFIFYTACKDVKRSGPILEK